MSNPNDLVIIRRADVEAFKQEAIFGVFRRDAVEWDKLNAMLSNAPVVGGDPVAYTDGKEDFMSVATYEEYKKLGFFTKCNQPLYTAPQQPQEQDELVRKAVADALEEAAKICDDYANSNFGSLVDSGQNGAYVCSKAIRALIKRNAHYDKLSEVKHDTK